MKNNMRNLVGWVKFNESMDEEKKCDCDQEDCGICNPEDKVEEKKKNPFAKMNAEKKKAGGKKTAPKKEDKKEDKKDGKKGNLPPWLKKDKK